MLKLLRNICFAFVALAPCGAHADKMVNVEYIHKLIEQRWGIAIPYNPELSTPKVAANMKYLLTLVDMTNKRINGTVTTDYGNGEFATMVAADTVAANTAITKLARIKPKFTITTTPNTTEFTFRMSAKGRFMVDWGDNTATEIVRTDTKNTTYTHEYKRAGKYKIKMTGRATEYFIVNTTNYNYSSAILFEYAPIAKIEGSLGAIFPTIGDGNEPWQQPRFYATFYGCKDLAGPIPENLFAGVRGAPIPRMFDATFYECVNLTGSIPEKLFAGIQGAPAERMFSRTFFDCKNLSGGIPEKLFTGIRGQPADNMFHRTFALCSGLDGEIPAGLFAGIKGQPAPNMFDSTFWSCRKLSGSIPAGLFDDIYGNPADNMFSATFLDCSKLTGEIPADLFGNLYGSPAKEMFRLTFGNCTKLSGCVPDGLFGDVGMTLDEIIAEYEPFRNSGVAPEYCSALAPKFTVTTTTDTNEFNFDMSARGLFKIDWGDGTSQIVNRTNTTRTTYSHEYDAPGEYQIGIGGYATEYNTADKVPAISFAKNQNVAGISGSLGAIFSTIGDGSEPGQQPRFTSLFSTNQNLTGPIPADLFTGVHGAPVSHMFESVFYVCHNLSGSIPEKLFAGIKGAPATGMFANTFYSCTGLSGEIPPKLFGDIYGAPAASMFSGTFVWCNHLTGSIPSTLFGKIKGEPAPSMFAGTFFNCNQLTGAIPGGLFGEINGAPASGMYSNTFSLCGGLSGEIPAGLFGEIYGAPAKEMFHSTFYQCKRLTGEIPENLFGKLSGPAAKNMFVNTFSYCTRLSGPSAKIDGKYLYDVWPDATAEQVGGCYIDASGLSDYDEIPDVWKTTPPQDE